MNTELARFNMIEQQIRPWDVLDAQVLELLARVKREDFVPAEHKALAFVDTQVPLLPGQPRGPAMLEPKVEARLLQALQVQQHESVLEIGCGSGFMAALLAHRAQTVVTMECRPLLARRARENLARAGLEAVRVFECRASDGGRGLPAEAPFDVIVLSGSVAEVPSALLHQLKPGGRLVAIVGQEPVMRACLYTRTGEAAWAKTDLFDTVAPRLEGFSEPTGFRF
ncbi:MAG: protein-L-isoaspartate O-methyltransferase [Ideonella sp. WA131b]|jgi:protein-L-isoaspartate(D-aspartate) O-methyltransferase|nr:protein-L-isoaspartate O-methyltransferase [Ideonella sp. WA131b]